MLWAAVLAAAAAAGISPGVSRPALAAGPAIGVALFVLLARERPRLPPPPLAVVAARATYLVGAAAYEELLWRGLALALTALWIGPVAALVATSVGFGIRHRRPDERGGLLHTATGLGFGTAFLLGGIAAAILAHVSYNLLVDAAVRAERRPSA